MNEYAKMSYKRYFGIIVGFVLTENNKNKLK
jgi:hypothetical protein